MHSNSLCHLDLLHFFSLRRCNSISNFETFRTCPGRSNPSRAFREAWGERSIDEVIINWLFPLIWDLRHHISILLVNRWHFPTFRKTVEINSPLMKSDSGRAVFSNWRFFPLSSLALNGHCMSSKLLSSFCSAHHFVFFPKKGLHTWCWINLGSLFSTALFHLYSLRSHPLIMGMISGLLPLIDYLPTSSLESAGKLVVRRGEHAERKEI